ncbi:DUF2157 domain-containing protein [Calothrix sp. PCC 6303]|uniref:DUF2157 domain-containing protein n=1 Tax=Calothrix sp. PCC 6303 TaxID=1170562 RepID=UPI0002A01469|nr:DUF2157 domain-containing protein [Calothrix sp. PCC 6303]AFZ00449.1 Protein of unknown function DUF2157, membrane [Calothrix sp. PCC 6303]
MPSNNFRVKLCQEARIWRDEGMINEGQYQQLVQRYQFETLEISPKDNFIWILIALGSIFLGLGIISFASANWEKIPREIKVGLLLSSLFTTNVIGFKLWRQTEARQRKQLLGEGLLILGALLLGINLLIIVQLFQLNIPNYEVVLVWAGGILIMAYSLGLASLGVFALILTFIGYWGGLIDLPNATNDLTWGRLVVEHLPLLLWLGYIPLAYLCRSRWVFVLGAIAFTISLQFNLQPWEYLTPSSRFPWLASFAFALPPLLLWSYDDRLFPWQNLRRFQPIARSLSLVFFCILFYIFSFHYYWQNSPSLYTQVIADGTNFNLTLLVDIICLSIIAIFQWFLLIRSSRNRIGLSSLIIFTWSAIAFLIPFWYRLNLGLEAIPIALFNCLLATLAVGLIRQALETGKRITFWGGMLLLILQILSRMLEYETNLLLKSGVFTGCGIVVILVGLWFENHLYALSLRSSKPPL